MPIKSKSYYKRVSNRRAILSEWEFDFYEDIKELPKKYLSSKQHSIINIIEMKIEMHTELRSMKKKIIELEITIHDLMGEDDE